MHRLKVAITLIFFGLGGILFGQNQALKLHATDPVYFQLPNSATVNFQTISFWIKPKVTWSPVSSVYIQPLVVKDKYTINANWGGRVAIYEELGKVKWTVNDYQGGSYTIESDRDTWYSDVWYHVACVMDPQQGMKMYVNGQLQQSTNAHNSFPPGPVEGPDEPYHVGCWGATHSMSTQATIDELRIWANARSESQIRDYMCREITCANYLIAGYKFDNATTAVAEDVCQLHTATGQSAIKFQAFVTSNAPLGNTSTHLYASNFTGEELKYLPGRDSVILKNINLPSNEGIHIYYRPGVPNTRGGLPDTVAMFGGVIGVWGTDTSASYDIRFEYLRNAPTCDDCSYIATRDLASQNWKVRTDLPLPNECGFELTNESVNGNGWREEYLPIDELSFNPALPDSLRICSNDPAQIQPYFMLGATYEWNDGVTTGSRFAINSGKYWVKMAYQRCIKYDTIFVELDSMPEFSWDRDTLICEGDTIELICPLPGVKYLWDTGDTTQSIKVWEKGLYELTTTYGNCSFSDIIAVQVTPALEVDLGPPDTLLCLGQRMSWQFNPSVGSYRWWNGATNSGASIFNQPGEYWVSLSNRCFTVYDTIQIEFEDCDCRIDIPNTFTPNDDWVNDETGVFTRCYFQYFEFTVMDRWGNRVFHTTNPHERWDGKYQDQQCEEGIYIYQLRYRRYTGPEEPVQRTGRMMLIR